MLLRSIKRFLASLVGESGEKLIRALVNQNLEEICAALRAKQAMDLAREAVEIVAFEPGFVGLALEEIEKGLEEAADAAGGGDRDGDNVQGEGKELTFAVR